MQPQPKIKPSNATMERVSIVGGPLCGETRHVSTALSQFDIRTGTMNRLHLYRRDPSRVGIFIHSGIKE